MTAPKLAVVIAIYIAIQLGYSFGLKHQAVLDICLVSSGFLIRAIAGGAATGIPLSQWFLLVMAFASLFAVAGKRYAELQVAERTGAQIRKALENYTATYLRFVWTTSATGAIVFYGLWAFERDGHSGSWFCNVDGPDHHRGSALRRRRRWRHGGRARGHRSQRPRPTTTGRRVGCDYVRRDRVRLSGPSETRSDQPRFYMWDKHDQPPPEAHELGN